MDSLSRRVRRQIGGFTLTELLVGVAIMGIVLSGVAAVQMISARGVHEMYSVTRSRSARNMALNEIRFRVADAKRGSVQLSDPAPTSTENPNPGYYRIQFQDPNLKTSGGAQMVSQFRFDASEGEQTLYYDDDINTSGGERKIARGLIYVLFEDGYPTGAMDPDTGARMYDGIGAAVTIRVQTSSNLAFSNVDVRDGETVVYLNNE